ncbi:MAG: ABC transporter permease [Anaerolineae bacterium]
MWARIVELVKYRELIKNLVIRDVKVRYKNSILGIFWSFLNPLIMMATFTVIFTVVMPVGIEKYPVFFLCGLLPWQFFSNSLVAATGSVVGNAPLIKKVYFPREVLPISAVFSNLIFFLNALALFFILSFFIFGVRLTWWILFLPAIIIIQMTFSIGLALIVSTLNVFYRDTEHIIGVLMQIWFFLTPIFYSADTIPRHYTLVGIQLDIWRLIHLLNPMAALVALYRFTLYQGSAPPSTFLLHISAISLASLVGGYIVFSRYSRWFGEII